MYTDMLFLASEGGSLDPLAFDPGAMILTLITFGISFVVLTKVCWKPILKAAKAREDRIADNLRAADEARAEAEKLAEGYKKQLEDAKAEVAALLEEGRREAGERKQEIVSKAHSEAESARDRANREIDLAREKAVAQLRAESVDLSIAIASKVIGSSLDDEGHRKLASDMLTEM